MAKTASLNATSRAGDRCTEGESCPAIPPGARAAANERTQWVAEATHALLAGDGTAITSLVEALVKRILGLIFPRARTGRGSARSKPAAGPVERHQPGISRGVQGQQHRVMPKGKGIVSQRDFG